MCSVCFVGLSTQPHDTGATSLPSCCPRQPPGPQSLSRLAFAIGLQRIVSSRRFPQASEWLPFRRPANGLSAAWKRQTARCTEWTVAVRKDLLGPPPYDFTGQLRVPVAAEG